MLFKEAPPEEKSLCKMKVSIKEKVLNKIKNYTRNDHPWAMKYLQKKWGGNLIGYLN